MKLTTIGVFLCLGFQPVALNAALSTNALELYYSFDSAYISSTYALDQWTNEAGLYDGVDTVWNSNPLSTFATGAKFGEALDVSTFALRPHQDTIDEVNAGFLPGLNDYTVTFWYRQSTPTAQTAVFGAGAWANDVNHSQGLLISVSTNGQLVVTYQDQADTTGVRKSFTAGSPIWDGATWNHLALVRTGTDLRLWVNGNSAGFATLSSGYNLAVSSAEWTRELYLGDYGGWPYAPLAVPNSAFDDMALFHRALSASEIAQIWNSGSGSTIGSLLLTNGFGDLTLIGSDDFSSYPDGLLAGSIGGAGFDFDNRPAGPPGHAAAASSWNVSWGVPTVLDAKLITQNGGVSRAYSGSATNGAVNQQSAGKVVYLRADMTRGDEATWSGIYSCEFATARLFFGVPWANGPSGAREFGIEEIGVGDTFNPRSPIQPVAGQPYTLVAKVDFTNHVFSFWVNPDLTQSEAANPPYVTRAYTGTNWSTALALSSSGSTSWGNVVAARAWSALATFPGALATYSTWIASYPGVGGASGFGQNADADAIPNGVEYVLGTDPSKPTKGLHDVSATSGSLVFHHSLQNSLASDVTWCYEWSTNLVDWVLDGSAIGGITVTTSRRVVTPGSLASDIEVTATVTGSATSTLFLRLKVIRTQVLQFHGIQPTDPNGTNGLANPDRGFRLEIAAGETQPGSKYYPLGVITELPLGVLTNLVGNESNDALWVKAIQYYRSQGLTMALAYIYLTDFSGGANLSAQKLAAINTSFAYARTNGVKLIPLFLYEYTSPAPTGPTASTILKHLGQLTNCFQLNADVMPWIRAGFIGAYGEWHHPYYDLLSDHSIPAAIIAKELAVVPPDMMVLMRVPQYKRWALGQESLTNYPFLSAAEAYSGTARARLGHANDGFLAGVNDGYTWPEAPLYANTGNPEFDMATVESAYTATEGEMFVQDYSGRVDGMQAILRLRLQHYCALSYFHSNNELELYGATNVPMYAINYWKQTPVTLSQLQARRLPISDGYFLDGAGNLVQRTQFEYIRDHLGYRLELQQARFPLAVAVGKPFDLNFTLINRGFATLHNPRPVFLALIDAQNQVTALPLASINPQQWQPHTPGDSLYSPLTHQANATVTLPQGLPAGAYRVGLWLPDHSASIRFNPAFAVRFANRDTPWWVSSSNQYGMNLIGTITVQ